MKHLFVDTAGWIARVNRSDRWHSLAKRIYQERFASGWQMVTHSGVMLEVGNGLSAISLREKAVLLNQRLGVSPNVEVVFVTEEIYEAAWLLYASRPDKEWGAVD